MVKKKPFKKSLKKSDKIKNAKEVFVPRKIKMLVLGAGGGASSIVSELAGGLKQVQFFVVDTDRRSFKRLKRGVKVLQIGEDVTRGWGTGMNAALAEKIARQSEEKINKIFSSFDMVILLSCLGGGVGSGMSPVFAEFLKKERKISVGIFTLPFEFEGEKKMRLAKNSLKDLRRQLSGTITLKNDDILKFSEKKSSLKRSLSLVNQILLLYLSDLIEIISLPGLINIDFADLKTVLKGRGSALCFGRGLGQGPTRAADAVKQVFENPFFGEPCKISRILFNISSGEDITLKEVEEISESIFRLNGKAKIIFGVSENKKLRKKVKITFLGASQEPFFEEKNSREETAAKTRKISAENGLKESQARKRNKKNSRGRERETGLKKEKPKKEAKKIGEKSKMRRSALDIKKDEEEKEKEEWFSEPEWEIPTFLRKKI